MADIVWGDALSVGIDEIDEDHRRLVDLFNMLNHSVIENDAQKYLEAVLEELINCTAWHFSHEERLMLKYDFDNIAEHKMEHQELIRSIRKLQHLVIAGRPVTNEELDFLESWLTGHILSADTELASYLDAVMK